MSDKFKRLLPVFIVVTIVAVISFRQTKALEDLN